MNTVKCKDCVRFDQKIKFEQGKRRLLWYGWCVANSTYPAKHPTGHVLPAGAVQVEEGMPHNAAIVAGDGVVSDCLKVLKKG